MNSFVSECCSFKQSHFIIMMKAKNTGSHTGEGVKAVIVIKLRVVSSKISNAVTHLTRNTFSLLRRPKMTLHLCTWAMQEITSASVCVVFKFYLVKVLT